MKLSKTLLGAIVVGITTQATTGCNKKDDPTPTSQKSVTLKEILKGQQTPTPDSCPGCGMG